MIEHMYDIREQFRRGTAGYRPVPFWFWNDDLSYEALEQSLEDMKDKGILEFLIHPRTGMEVEYLSEEFFKRVTFVVDWAADHDMKVWLYDEFNWPSGAVAGKLLREHPEWKMRCLAIQVSDGLSGVERVIRYPGRFLRAFQCHDQSYTPLIEKAQDGTFIPERGEGHFETEPWGEFKCTPETSRVLVFSVETNHIGWAHVSLPDAMGAAGFPDKLNPAAIDRFIELTHEEYDRRLGHYFGGVIVGMFTDEPAAWTNPNMQSFMEPVRWSSMVWSEQIAETFHILNGYDLLERLPELVYETGKWSKTRIDFWSTASQMYREAYFQKIGKWCKNRNIIFTGHLNTEESPDTLVRYETGIFHGLREMDIPGYDFLASRPGYELPEFTFSSKLVSSIAHAFGKGRVMCEIFGASGWQTSLADCKRTINWIMANGINTLSTHGYFQSIRGMRKRDYPPSHSKHEPWWAYYRQFTEYVDRIGQLTSSGDYVGDVAVLFSFANQYSRYSVRHWTMDDVCREPRTWLKDPYWKTHVDFCRLLLTLQQNQRDFDFIFDEQWKENLLAWEGGELITPGGRYRVLLVPPVETMLMCVAEGILSFVKQGGIVVWLGSPPKHSENGPYDSQLQRVLNDLLPIESDKKAMGWKIREHSRIGKVLWIDVPLETIADADLCEILEALHPSELQIEGPGRRNCISIHRSAATYEIYYVANVGSEAVAEMVSIRKTGVWEVWDPETGEQKKIEPALRNGDISCFMLSLEPAVAMAFICRQPKTVHFPEFVNYSLEKPNVWCLTNMAVLPIGQAGKHWWNPNYDDSLWHSCEVSKTYWEPPYVPKSIHVAGQDYVLRSSFFAEHVPENLQLVIEDDNRQAVVYVNGIICKQRKKIWVWDESNTAYEIGSFVKPGQMNFIVIRQMMPDFIGGFHPPFHGMEPIVLRGAFAVADERMIPLPEKVGFDDWRKQGFPHFVGALDYEAEIECDSQMLQSDSIILVLPEVKETADIWVNYQHVGTKISPPFRMEIRPHVRSGNNHVKIRVTNTSANLLGESQPSGLLQKPYLII